MPLLKTLWRQHFGRANLRVFLKGTFSVFAPKVHGQALEDDGSSSGLYILAYADFLYEYVNNGEPVDKVVKCAIKDKLNELMNEHCHEKFGLGNPDFPDSMRNMCVGMFKSFEKIQGKSVNAFGTSAFETLD